MLKLAMYSVHQSSHLLISDSAVVLPIIYRYIWGREEEEGWKKETFAVSYCSVCMYAYTVKIPWLL